mmetsp:Transcript_87056/g.270813  ORF Transcript_87056/g.270813 Transcript_87056/m.270813 type:complete len:338 (-) Transcript_87056:30-1043(-)
MDVLRGLGSSERPIAEVVRGLDVVRTLLANIAKAPGDDRFRNVRKANPRIAALLGLEEEGLLRAAGFEDFGDLLACPGGCSGGDGGQPGVPPQLTEVLDVIAVARAVLQEKLEEEAAAGVASGAPTGPVCRDAAVARALECTLLDHVAQRSSDLAEAEKRRRRSAEADAVRSPRRWRDALREQGGEFLCDGGPVEAWLDADAAHRGLAHDLLLLQESAMRWYGSGARRHCAAWRSQLASGGSGADSAAGPRCGDGGGGLGALLAEELQRLREALFEFPERAGAAPELFRDSGPLQPEALAAAAGVAGVGAEGAGDCALVAVCAPGREVADREVVALE